MPNSPKTFVDVQRELDGKAILVANRGIPARRILRTIRERFHGVPVATATDVDKTSPAINSAQELILLGKDHRAYLDIDLIIREAKRRGVAAIHPGWGFASENAEFPRKCAEAGIVFIGPTAEAMNLLGNKVEVRRLAKALDIPVVPGSEGAVTMEEARGIAKEIGLPVMLKAEGGGGGRGIYEVYREEELDEAFEKAQTMASASFGNPRLYVERLLTSVRHIEIQVAADKHGNVFAFDERDCTVQRNHQKLIEITPSPWPGMTEELRASLKEYATRLVSHVGYHSLCTVEFLLSADGTPYLIEVNTRLQVEHGITEVRYGVDLVEEQIAIAFGAELRFRLHDEGEFCRNPVTRENEFFHPFLKAVQVRVNCEDPQKNFTPNAGVITRYISPGGPGIRLDSCISVGYEFPSQYDSAASLLIAYGRTWDKVNAVMQRAIDEYFIGGLKTTLPFYAEIFRHPRFLNGAYDTNFVRDTPELMCYRDVEPQEQRLSRLICEISAKGHNPYLQYGEYRTAETPRMSAFIPVLPDKVKPVGELFYPSYGRENVLDFIRETRAGKILHFTDTTTRDITQSNSGNRFRLAEDRICGPYLDDCNFFSLENGGGAHFHVAMLANMTYPFTEAEEWNHFAPKSRKQILIRSTNVLGYKPQPKNLMRVTGEMICEHYDVIRCFDFLNHVENMRPFAEVAMADENVIFEPAVSLSYKPEFFTVAHYMEVVREMIEMVADAGGTDTATAMRRIILGLKDMAGVCPPRFMRELIRALRETYPELVLHYHRHYTDGLFVPSVAAAAEAGAHIVDTAIGSSVRWYGQGDVLATASYIEDELGLRTMLNKEAIRETNYVLKQIMPYYDRYCSPYFQGIDHDVVSHGMPGGATSSSQEGAMKQGYIQLLPYMLKFLAGTRRIVHYHDVTPGSQITWNTAFLAVTSAFKRGGKKEVRDLLGVLDYVAEAGDSPVSEDMAQARLALYADANDAFRKLLLGEYGKLPLGWPPDWVYESAFGAEYENALEERDKRGGASPLTTLADLDLGAEETALSEHLGRKPTEEEFVMYLNHPGDALKTIDFRNQFGDPNQLPLHVWFEGLKSGEPCIFTTADGKPHRMTILDISAPDTRGQSVVRYELDSEVMSYQVKVAEPTGPDAGEFELAEIRNEYHVASPSNGDLWVMYVSPGDIVHRGEELFNIAIMKQEKAVLSPRDGIVKRVLKTADYLEDKKMVPVHEGELLVELGPVPKVCHACNHPLMVADCKFCAHCGARQLHTSAIATGAVSEEPAEHPTLQGPIR